MTTSIAAQTEAGIFEFRRQFCEDRLGQLRSRVLHIPELKRPDLGLCIYVTGSYGRQEASECSDLDLFFIQSPSVRPITNIDKTLIDAELIRTTRELEFGEFSGDGEYLQIHDLREILEALGSPEDDYRNFFTARMLLLLESSPIFNEVLYEDSIKKIVEAYYRDYHDHEDDFRPVFLVNDIVRFWKTLCLNYEHKRNRPDLEPAKKNAAHIKNLKLKFSRMLTCFSTLLLLAQENEMLSPERLMEIVLLSPLDRLRRATLAEPVRQELLVRILAEYAWFLEATARPKEELLRWIDDRSSRNAAFEHARAFGRAMYDLLFEVAKDGDTIRYLVI